MDLDFNTIADDFFVNVNLETTLSLPSSRETVLHFFEAVQKQFRSMTSFFRRETGEFVLEGNRDGGTYRWLELQPHRITSGFFNPSDLQQAYEFHSWVLERSRYFLGVAGLDVECLDMLFGFNLDYHGNRDAIVAQALLAGSPLASFVHNGDLQAVECEPNLVMALDEECYLQMRLSLETRSSSYQVRTGEYDDEPISVYLTLRRYSQPGQVLDIAGSLVEQGRLCEEIVGRTVIPGVIQPIVAAISAS